MRKKFTGRHSLPLITLLSCLHLPLHAQQAEPIGVVISTKGLVQARNAAGAVRTLARRSEIFEDDTILVGADGMAQVRMADDARISFAPNTEFTFNEYQFDDNPATPDNAVMSMVRGGFRTISGSVGEADADSYRVDTPMASIGIRGTTHEGAIVGNILFTGVSTGGTTVSNNFGDLDLGTGGDYDFSQTEEGQGPVGLLIPPTVLLGLNSLTTPPTEDDGGDGAPGTEGNNGDANDNNGNGNDGANNAGADGNGNNDGGGGNNAGGGGGNAAGGGGNNAGGGGNAGGGNAGGGNANNNVAPPAGLVAPAPAPVAPPPAPAFNNLGGGFNSNQVTPNVAVPTTTAPTSLALTTYLDDNAWSHRRHHRHNRHGARQHSTYQYRSWQQHQPNYQFPHNSRVGSK